MPDSCFSTYLFPYIIHHLWCRVCDVSPAINVPVAWVQWNDRDSHGFLLPNHRLELDFTESVTNHHRMVRSEIPATRHVDRGWPVMERGDADWVYCSWLYACLLLCLMWLYTLTLFNLAMYIFLSVMNLWYSLCYQHIT